MPHIRRDDGDAAIDYTYRFTYSACAHRVTTDPTERRARTWRHSWQRRTATEHDSEPGANEDPAKWPRFGGALAVPVRFEGE